MKFNQRKQEKGSILMEVIAVIAVLGVMGPLLFKQVSDRNEEIENINIASEIRTIKEAFSAYIMSYKAEILKKCANAEDCSIFVLKDDVERFLPRGFDVTLESDYDLKLLRDNLDDGTTQLQGFVLPKLENMGLENITVRQAARIANLIGADGGIHMNGSIEILGTGGSWSIPSADIGIGDGSATTFLATTGIDTFSPEVRLEDFDQANIFLPNSLGMTDLHAWNYFSVGGSQSGSSNSCFQLNHTKRGTGDSISTAQDDKIYVAGESAETGLCDPYFWVGAEANAGGKTSTGDVYIKQNLHFRTGPRANDSIVIASGCDKDNCTTEVASNRHITVYGVNGLEKIIIDGTGKIVSKGTTQLMKNETVDNEADEKEELKIKNGRIESNAYAEISSAAYKNETNVDARLGYKIDPRYTSIMNDIRLESRGGARLSDLLPNYNLVSIETINGPTNKTISKPSCPPAHAPAIAVTPVSWNTATEKTITDAVASKMVIEGSILKQKVDTPPSNTSTLYPKVIISDAPEYVVKDSVGNTGAWLVSVDYTDTSIDTPITALAYLYCYFEPQSSEARRARNRPDDPTE